MLHRIESSGKQTFSNFFGCMIYRVKAMLQFHDRWQQQQHQQHQQHQQLWVFMKNIVFFVHVSVGSYPSASLVACNSCATTSSCEHVTESTTSNVFRCAVCERPLSCGDEFAMTADDMLCCRADIDVVAGATSSRCTSGSGNTTKPIADDAASLDDDVIVRTDKSSGRSLSNNNNNNNNNNDDELKTNFLGRCTYKYIYMLHGFFLRATPPKNSLNIPWVTISWVSNIIFTGPDRSLYARIYNNAILFSRNLRQESFHHPLRNNKATDLGLFKFYSVRIPFYSFESSSC